MYELYKYNTNIYVINTHTYIHIPLCIYTHILVYIRYSLYMNIYINTVHMCHTDIVLLSKI